MMVDYSNRLRRNNIVIHNLPENFEKRYAARNLQPDDQSAANDAGGSEPNQEGSTPETPGPDAPSERDSAVSYANAARAPRPPPMERLMEQFLLKELGLKVEVDAAHRTNSRVQNDSDNRPRLIHVRCLRREDRDRILKAAPAKLRGRKFNGESVFVTDDIDPETREDHKRLVVKMKEMREVKKYFAFVPWSVPRVTRYKEGRHDSDLPLQTYRLHASERY